MKARYAFELSGEHKTLPRSEARSLLDICSSAWREDCQLEGCLVVQAEDLDASELASRLAMTHRITEVLAICQDEPSAISEAAAQMPLPQGSYRIRARRIKQAAMSDEKNAVTPTDQVERLVGSSLFRRGLRADLSSPDLDLRATITSHRVIIGREVGRVQRGSFESRRPHLKPFFHPGVLMPRVARALVNLSQVRSDELLLDPFSGTGGILVEACLAGASGLGVDVQKKLVSGARSNLAGLECTLAVGDARRLPLKESSVDAAVFDIPYGRSALIRAASRDELLERSLSEVFRVLKPGRRAVVVADRSIEGEIALSGLETVEIHSDRIHRSLTRQIFLCAKGLNA